MTGKQRMLVEAAIGLAEGLHARSGFAVAKEIEDKLLEALELEPRRHPGDDINPRSHD